MKKFFKFFQKDIVIGWLLILGCIFPLLTLRFEGQINPFNTIDPNKAGQIGSWLAGTTGLLWALASVLFIYKSFEQSREQNKVNLAQRDENNFFNLMDNLHTIVGNTESEEFENLMDIESYSDTGRIKYKSYKGTSFFSRFFREFYNYAWDKDNLIKYLKDHEQHAPVPFVLKEKEEETPLRENSDSIDRPLTLSYIIWCYKQVYSIYQAQLGHFFRLVLILLIMFIQVRI